MMKVKKTMLLAVLAVILNGCATNGPTRSTIINLTPPELSRSPENQYLIECLWNSNQQTIRKDSFKAYVMVGLTFYEMRQVPLVENRWEAIVPGIADQNTLNYRIKFEYLYNRIPEARRDSKRSEQYQLRIVD